MGLIADIRAMKEVQRIKNGSNASFSVSSITNMIINLSDASHTLSKDDYMVFFALYWQKRCRCLSHSLCYVFCCYFNYNRYFCDFPFSKTR